MSKQWVVVPGDYGVLAGDSSRDLPLKAQLAVIGGQFSAKGR